MIIKIVKQNYTTPQGVKESYGIIINGIPKYTFYSKEEYEAFRKGLDGR